MFLTTRFRPTPTPHLSTSHHVYPSSTNYYALALDLPFWFFSLLERIRFPFCTEGPHPLTVFGFFASCANSSTGVPCRNFAMHHRIYRRSLTATPAFRISKPDLCQNSSHAARPSASEAEDVLVSISRPIFFRKSWGVVIVSVGEGIGFVSALLTSERV